jgi:hypothetical protein
MPMRVLVVDGNPGAANRRFEALGGPAVRTATRA